MMSLLKYISVILISFIAISCKDSNHDHSESKDSNKEGEPKIINRTDPASIDTVKKSLPAIVKNKIGYAHFTIRYHSPAVRSRVIWGGLVPFDEIWVTGAHSATTLESDHAFTIGGKSIPAGKYALFTIPSRQEWTVIINKNWDQHLTDEYSEADDIHRFKLKPDTLSSNQERLMYYIDQWDGNIEMGWERLHIIIPVRVND